MAVSEEIVASLVEAVAALNLRVNDSASRSMIQGPSGDDGEQGDKGEDAPPVTDEQIKGAAENWLRANITQPGDGINGADGTDGQRGDQGRTPTDEEIEAAVVIWFEANRESLRGPAGKDGADGIGRDGRNGTDGRDGRDGTDGTDGVGVALVEQRSDKSFFVTLTDGQETEIMLPVGKASGFFGGGGSGGGGGATLLSELGDVRISAPMDLHVLQYDTESSVWRNGPGILDGGTFN